MKRKNIVVWTVVLLMCLATCVSSVIFKQQADGAMLFIHIYSNRYNTDATTTAIATTGKSLSPPRTHQRLVTIGLHSGQHFFADIPNDYEPEVQIEGRVFATADFLPRTFDCGFRTLGLQLS